jgi:pyruvate,water dikinase
VLVPLEIARVQDRPDLGGKAANLGEIASLGLNVPKGFVIPVCVWDAITASGITPGFRLEPETINKVLGANFNAELMEWFDSLGAELVSVRSSSVVEDSMSLSFAGVFDSIIGVHRETLLQAVAKCWAGGFSPKARAYCQANNVAPEDVRIAIIIQALVKPTTSGVCFTRDPISNRNSHLLIEAAYGFGQAIVSGEVTPDIYVYDSGTRTIASRVVSEQQVELMFIADQLRETETLADVRKTQKLSDGKIHHVAEQCIKIRDHFGSDQDIEFAYDVDTLFFLQTRPITKSRKEGKL